MIPMSRLIFFLLTTLSVTVTGFVVHGQTRAEAERQYQGALQLYEDGQYKAGADSAQEAFQNFKHANNIRLDIGGIGKSCL